MSQLFRKVLTSRRWCVLYSVVAVGIPLWLYILYNAHADGVLTFIAGLMFGIVAITGSALMGLFMWYVAVQPTMSGIRLAESHPQVPSNRDAETQVSIAHVGADDRVFVALSGTVNTWFDRTRIASVVMFGAWWRVARTLGISLFFAAPVLILLLVNERQLTAVALIGVAVASVAPVVLLLAWQAHAMRMRQGSGTDYRCMVLSAKGIGFGEDEDEANHDTSVRWTDFDRVSEGRKDFYFWRSGRLLFALPKHHLASEEAVGAVRGLLKQSGIWKS